MELAYQKELDFTAALLRRLRLPVHLFRPEDALPNLDNGLRTRLGMEEDYQHTYSVISHWSDKRTIYTIVDQFLCHYIYFHLPPGTQQSTLVIGPYLTSDLSRTAIMELAEQLGIPLRFISLLADYYASLPVFIDPAAIMAIVSTFGEVLWGRHGGFHIVDVDYEQQHVLPASVDASEPIEQEDVLQRMAQLEERYAYENELMDIVSKGLTNRADMMMSSVSQLNYQRRLADPLRNMKNYAIICNTLLRKAAEKGGVHPLHLDKMSSHFAQQIENLPGVDKSNALLGDMIRAYCRLVRTRAGQQYSAVVQKTLTYIDANLSGDLSLSSLARMMQVSPGYLSTIFHRETGHTLAEHITTLRMRAALQLIKSTRLQVQTVAQLIGFSDPNYFSKQFKRYYGVTPLQYRKDQPALSSQAGV